MKLLMALFTGAALLSASPDSGPAQDTTTAAEVAAHQEAEERYKRLNAAVEDLIAAQAAQQKKISKLMDELRSLRDENSKAVASAATRDDLQSLAEKVRELDKQREADKKLILEEFQKLAKLVAAGPMPAERPERTERPRHTSAESKSPATEKNASTGGVTPLPEKGFYYTIQPNDTLSGIVNAYRKEGVKVTVDMVKLANPTVKENKLIVGKKIFIPAP